MLATYGLIARRPGDSSVTLSVLRTFMLLVMNFGNFLTVFYCCILCGDTSLKESVDSGRFLSTVPGPVTKTAE